jgi:hypothetical protein
MSPTEMRWDLSEGDTALKARLKELFAPFVTMALEAVLEEPLQKHPEYAASLQAQLKERFDLCLDMSVDETLYTMRLEDPHLDASYEALVEPLESVLKDPLELLLKEYFFSLCVDTYKKEALNLNTHQDRETPEYVQSERKEQPEPSDSVHEKQE